MPSHFLPKGFQPKEWAYLQELELANIEPRNITVIVGADVPGALIQLDIKKDKESQQLVIQIPFGCTIFGSSQI